MKYLIPPVALFFLLFVSCKKQVSSSTPVVCDPTISFQNQVKPLLKTYCDISGCHDDRNMPSLSNYSTSKDGSSQIQNALKRNIMPPNNSLSTTDRNTILCWISNGSLNN